MHERTREAWEAWQRVEDEDTIRRWELLHGRYQTHRRAVGQLAQEMREAAPAYCAAVHRERRRYDEEHSEPAA